MRGLSSTGARKKLRTELVYLRGLLGVYLQPNTGGEPGDAAQQADELRYVIAIARERLAQAIAALDATQNHENPTV